MKFKVKQKKFSFGGRYTIENEHGEAAFILKGKAFSSEIRMFDFRGSECVRINRRGFFSPRYEIRQSRRITGTIRRRWDLRPKFTVDSVYGELEIEGNFLGLDYRIKRGPENVAFISKKYFAFSDTYGVFMDSFEDHAFILALVVVLDKFRDADSQMNQSAA